MREIEVKFRVTDKDALFALLHEKGIKLSTPIRQTDYLFVKPGTPRPRVPKGYPIYRVRVQDQKSEITLKIPNSDKGGVVNSQDSHEYETTVGDPAVMLRFFESLDLETYPTVSKVRQKGKIGDIEICIDEVEELGSFIEAEKLISDDTPAEKVQEELRIFLESLAIPRENEVINGKYDVMLWEKQQKK